MVEPVKVLKPAPRDVGVDLGGRDIAVTEQHLNYPQVSASIKHVSREDVRVRR